MQNHQQVKTFFPSNSFQSSTNLQPFSAKIQHPKNFSSFQSKIQTSRENNDTESPKQQMGSKSSNENSTQDRHSSENKESDSEKNEPSSEAPPEMWDEAENVNYGHTNTLNSNSLKERKFLEARRENTQESFNMMTNGASPACITEQEKKDQKAPIVGNDSPEKYKADMSALEPLNEGNNHGGQNRNENQTEEPENNENQNIEIPLEVLQDNEQLMAFLSQLGADSIQVEPEQENNAEVTEGNEQVDPEVLQTLIQLLANSEGSAEETLQALNSLGLDEADLTQLLESGLLNNMIQEGGLEGNTDQTAEILVANNEEIQSNNKIQEDQVTNEQQEEVTYENEVVKPLEEENQEVIQTQDINTNNQPNIDITQVLGLLGGNQLEGSALTELISSLLADPNGDAMKGLQQLLSSLPQETLNDKKPQQNFPSNSNRNSNQSFNKKNDTQPQRPPPGIATRTITRFASNKASVPGWEKPQPAIIKKSTPFSQENSGRNWHNRNGNSHPNNYRRGPYPRSGDGFQGFERRRRMENHDPFHSKPHPETEKLLGIPLNEISSHINSLPNLENTKFSLFNRSKNIEAKDLQGKRSHNELSPFLERVYLEDSEVEDGEIETNKKIKLNSLFAEKVYSNMQSSIQACQDSIQKARKGFFGLQPDFDFENIEKYKEMLEEGYYESSSEIEEESLENEEVPI